MKDKEVKLEETESSHTLGGSIKYTQIHQSHWVSHKSRGTYGYTSEMHVSGDWEGADSKTLSDTVTYINLVGLTIGLFPFRGPTHILFITYEEIK